MADVQVKCINKQPRNDTHEGITHLGGAGWKWTRAEVIASILARTNTFYTLVNGKRADVAVVDGPNGKVRAHARRRLLQRQPARPSGVRGGLTTGDTRKTDVADRVRVPETPPGRHRSAKGTSKCQH